MSTSDGSGKSPRRCLKTESDGAEVTSDGSLFRVSWRRKLEMIK